MNSMSLTVPLARYTMAIPSPVATSGVGGSGVYGPTSGGHECDAEEEGLHFAGLLVEDVGTVACDVGVRRDYPAEMVLCWMISTAKWCSKTSMIQDSLTCAVRGFAVFRSRCCRRGGGCGIRSGRSPLGGGRRIRPRFCRSPLPTQELAYPGPGAR